MKIKLLTTTGELADAFGPVTRIPYGTHWPD